IERLIGRHASVQVKVLLDPALPFFTKSLPKPWIRCKPQNRLTECYQITHRNDKPSLPVDYSFRIPACVSDDHGKSGAHSFEDGVRKPLLVRGQKTNVTRGKQVRNIVS